MKKTKFKVYDYDTNTMYTQDDLIITFDSVGEDVYVYRNGSVEPLYRYELLQYIGSNDTFDNEIYEGDIIKRTDLTPTARFYGKEEIGVVKYENAQFVLKISEHDYYEISHDGTFHINMSDYEVMGNIYETSEILQSNNIEN
ncbi:YopX family protein [Terrisporobacter sp.]|uniref:YopX family protein n=1 Tax=Terrisporobacter sp. TaxID=1965305 RepID=UPI0026323C12|nr:YopX family protein [Terrisporobacter sp.]